MIEKVKYCSVRLPEGKSFVFDHVHILWNRHIPFHQHAAWQVTYMIKGSGTRIIGEVVEPFSRGEVVLVPPDLPHCWAYDNLDLDAKGKIENITIVFPGSFLENLADLFPEMHASMTELRGRQSAIRFEGSVQSALQAEMMGMKTQDDVEQLSTMLRICRLMTSSQKAKVVGFSSDKREKIRAKLLDVTRYIVNNYERRITLNDVSKYLNMNRSAFCTFFKRETGKPFISYLNEYRIDCSCVMLRDTNMPVADICFAVGFEDVPHYNRTFKKYKGGTPGTYRASQQ